MADTPDEVVPNGETAEEEANRLAAYDLNDDGHVGPIEEIRGTLGLVDARLEQVADEGGVIGKIADAAHQIVDRLDNDES